MKMKWLTWRGGTLTDSRHDQLPARAAPLQANPQSAFGSRFRRRARPHPTRYRRVRPTGE